MSNYRYQNFRQDQGEVTRLTVQASQTQIAVIDGLGQLCTVTDFRTPTEYDYHYGEAMMADCHRRLNQLTRMDKLLTRQLVYLNDLPSETVMMVAMTVARPRLGTSHVMVQSPLRATRVGTVRQRLLRQQDEVRTTQATVLAQVERLIPRLEHLLARLYAQRIDPADFIAASR